MRKKLTDRQQEILDFLVQAVHERGYAPTIREIRIHCGLASNQGIVRHLDTLEQGGWIRRDPNSARSIVVSPELLEVSGGVEAPLDPVRMVPLVGNVAAGQPITAVQDIEERLPVREDWLPVDERSFFLRVRGDSMAEAIQPGDLVLVEPRLEIRRGEIVVAMIDDEATVKRFYPEPERVVLRSDNPSYADIVVSRDFRVVGRVSALIRKYR